MAKLTDYKNFWLIWLGCAANSEGTSIFRLQQAWGITTNYLYHKEAGIGKPIVKQMAENGFLAQDKSRFRARFEWVPSFVLERHPLPHENAWSMNTRVIEKWPIVQKFIEDHRRIVFDAANLRTLYRNNLDNLKSFAPSIFDDMYLFAVLSSLVPFCTKYHATIVSRMLNTVVSVQPEKDVLGYFAALRQSISPSEMPQIIKDESELLQTLSPQ